MIAAAVDAAALERLFDLYDERERAYQDFRKQRFVKGSQGQDVLNPLGRLITSLDNEIRQLEDRYGFSPRSRMNLGLELEEPDPAPASPATRTARSRPDPRTAKGAGK